MAENKRLLTPEELRQGIDDYFWCDEMPMDTGITREDYAVAIAQDLKTRQQTAREIFEVYDHYITLLVDELNDVVSLAATHGWKSQHIEQGKKCRKDIQSLKSRYQEEKK